MASRSYSISRAAGLLPAVSSRRLLLEQYRGAAAGGRWFGRERVRQMEAVGVSHKIDFCVSQKP